MTAERIGLGPAILRPWIIRLAPDQVSSWNRVGNCFFEKCWNFCRTRGLTDATSGHELLTRSKRYYPHLLLGGLIVAR